MGLRHTNPAYPPVAAQLRRRRVIRRGIFAAAVTVLGLVLVDHAGCLGYRGNDWSRFDRNAVIVTEVIGACDLSVRTRDAGRVAIVHLLGADPPVGVAADATTRYTVARLLGKTGVLWLDPLQTRDSGGRLLGYFYLADADVFNVDLVHDGLAYSDRRINHMLRAPMDGAESDARKHQRGVWKDEGDTAMPEWRRQWVHDLRAHHRTPE